MNQRKILLLENVTTQAAGVRDHLAQAGFQVAVSRYEADGLKRLAEWVPDLILVSTAHPAGDFVEYCRRVRAIAPSGRIVVTSSHGRDRLFKDHPGLQAIVDGVLVRPYSNEDVAALLPPVAGEPQANAPDAAAEPDSAALRAEFQRQLEAKFLEVEELKRRLEVAVKRASSAPGLEWLQSENEHLRQGVEEAKRKAELALAMEQLKRSEIEVKLDNLLRMKEDFEFRAQNEIEERAREIELVRGQFQELRERSDREAGDLAALRIEMERALIEKEQLEERLHSLEAAGASRAAAEEPRIAGLEAELARQRAMAAEAQLAQADLAAKAAILEETLSREQAAREGRQQQLAQVQALREGAEAARRQAAQLQAQHEGALERLAAVESSAAEAQAALLAESARRTTLEKELAEARAARAGEQESASGLQRKLAAAESSAAEAQAATAAAGERLASLEKDLADVRRERSADARMAQERRSEFTARTHELLERAVSAERRSEQLQSAVAEIEGRLGASEAARSAAAAEAAAGVEQRVDALERELAQERERSKAALEERDREIASLRSVREESEKAAQGAALIGGELAESRARGRELEEERERLSASLEGREREIASLRSAREESGKAAQAAALLGRELADSRDGVRELTQERERLRASLEERERVLAGEARAWRDKAEAAAIEIQLLTSQGAERASRDEEERRMAAELQERAGRELAERELRIAALREELAAEGEARRRETRELEGRLAARAAPEAPEAGENLVRSELRRIQELLEEVVTRARTEAVDYARRDAELSARLQAALEERRLLQERFDRASAEASERERRSSSLLQSAIVHGSSPPQERANLPVPVPVPPERAPTPPRRWPIPLAIAGVTLAVLLTAFGLRRAAPPSPRQQESSLARPQAGASPGAATTPREVWDRWTRSDSSGGVLVQATLRSEQELRAEVEADRARGMSDEEARAELARRLGAFRFDTTRYVTVYLKHFAPGYPSYLDDLPGRFRLRDSEGREAPAFLPPGHEKDYRIFSFGSGSPADQIYEASVVLGFDRAGLSRSAGYLQLVVSDVGAASRRVLTWELE